MGNLKSFSNQKSSSFGCLHEPINTMSTTQRDSPTTSNQVDELIQSFSSLGIPKTHSTVGFANVIANMKHIRTLLTHRRLPDRGWSDFDIQWFLSTVAALDTNQKGPGSRWCGVGEREGRVYSSLVAQRHFGLSHGVGRSGDLSEPQPKAVGSSVLHRLSVHLALDAVRRGSGLTMAKSGAM